VPATKSTLDRTSLLQLGHRMFTGTSENVTIRICYNKTEKFHVPPYSRRLSRPKCWVFRNC